MKILIIGTARSGTTSLMLGLQDSLGGSYSSYDEPYNYATRLKQGLTFLYPYDWKDNSIVKMLVTQMPSQFRGSRVEYFKELTEQFDRVIILKRKNYNDALISYCHAMNEVLTKGKFRWHSGYSLEGEVDTSKHGWYMKSSYKVLDEVMQGLGIPFTYYEDIYSGDKSKVDLFISNNNLPIENNLLHDWLNPKRRYLKSKGPMYKLFSYNDDCVLEIKSNTVVYPEDKKYQEFLKWKEKYSDEYNFLVTKKKAFLKHNKGVPTVTEEEGRTIKCKYHWNGQLHLKEIFEDDEKVEEHLYSINESEYTDIPSFIWRSNYFKKGKLVREVNFHPNGGILHEHEFISTGVKYKEYFDNGGVRSYGELNKKSTMVGKWIFNHGNGKKESEIEFDNGKILTAEVYYEDGTPNYNYIGIL